MNLSFPICKMGIIMNLLPRSMKIKSDYVWKVYSKYDIVGIIIRVTLHVSTILSILYELTHFNSHSNIIREVLLVFCF